MSWKFPTELIQAKTCKMKNNTLQVSVIDSQDKDLSWLLSDISERLDLHFHDQPSDQSYMIYVLVCSSLAIWALLPPTCVAQKSVCSYGGGIPVRPLVPGLFLGWGTSAYGPWSFLGRGGTPVRPAAGGTQSGL